MKFTIAAALAGAASVVLVMPTADASSPPDVRLTVSVECRDDGLAVYDIRVRNTGDEPRYVRIRAASGGSYDVWRQRLEPGERAHDGFQPGSRQAMRVIYRSEGQVLLRTRLDGTCS